MKEGNDIRLNGFVHALFDSSFYREKIRGGFEVMPDRDAGDGCRPIPSEIRGKKETARVCLPFPMNLMHYKAI
jgi:hypothetical protein